MKYEDAIIKWAERRYGLTDVSSVDFELEVTYGGYCETCHYTDVILEVTIKFTSGGIQTIEESRYDFGALIQEICKVANEE